MGIGTRPMAVVLIQRVQRAGFDAELLAGRNQLYFAAALHAISGFQVVLVPDVGFGSGKDRGLMHGKAHAIIGQQQAAAGPGIGLYITLGVEDVFEASYDHAATSRLATA